MQRVARRLEVVLKVGLLLAIVQLAAPPRLCAQRVDAEPRSKTLQINGVTLHYLEWGNERARPIVLLHPAPLNARVWDRFAPEMATRFHVVAPDARGFGDSSWSDTYDPDVFVADLLALMDALRLERPILVGNSMGGTLGYMFAGLHPDRVERLILLDTGPGDPPSPSPGAVTADRRARSAADSSGSIRQW